MSNYTSMVWKWCPSCNQYEFTLFRTVFWMITASVFCHIERSLLSCLDDNTVASLQKSQSFTVAAPSSFQPGSRHEGIHFSKVELGLPIPPTLALGMLPHPWMLLVNFSCYWILIGDIPVSSFKNKLRKGKRDTVRAWRWLTAVVLLDWLSLLPSTFSAAQYFPAVSSTQASILSEIKKLLW